MEESGFGSAHIMTDQDPGVQKTFMSKKDTEETCKYKISWHCRCAASTHTSSPLSLTPKKRKTTDASSSNTSSPFKLTRIVESPTKKADKKEIDGTPSASPGRSSRQRTTPSRSTAAATPSRSTAAATPSRTTATVGTPNRSTRRLQEEESKTRTTPSQETKTRTTPSRETKTRTTPSRVTPPRQAKENISVRQKTISAVKGRVTDPSL